MYSYTESDWDLETSSPAKMTNSLPNVAEPDAGKTLQCEGECSGFNILLTVF